MLPKLTKKVTAANVLEDATVRDFSGGWNVLDDDLNLNSKFSTRLYNCFIDADGSVTVRYGTELFADFRAACTDPTAYIVNMEYFDKYLIGVMSNGEIISATGDGLTTRIWDSTIATTQGTVTWGAISFCSIAQVNGGLILGSGEDKPLLIRKALSVEYLQDEGTGTNINTPIAKYVLKVGRYTIWVGDPLHPDRVHISAKDARGTYYGDPDPNDATFIDVGSILPNSSAITGAAAFRDKVVIFYPEGSIIGTLGVYNDDGVHLPSFEDAIEHYGSISHRAALSYGEDMLMMDLVGVPSLKRTVFSGSIKPERVSDLVDPEISAVLSKLNQATLEDRVFGIYNQREGQFMFFVPNSSALETTTQTVGYIFNFRPSLKVAAWSRFDGWNWTCAARSTLGNIFFGDKNGKVWLYGNLQRPVYSDYIQSGIGTPINFDWELPWSDINKRVKTKTSKYLSFDARGSAEFTVSMYVDRYLEDGVGADKPLLSMEFTGGAPRGFGAGAQPFGGGRNTANEHLYAWPAKFMLMKLRIRGSTTEPLKFSAISLQYQGGGNKR